MDMGKLAAIVLIAAGILGLAYGGFSYTKETHEANIGPLEMKIEENETVKIPVWLSAGAIIGGAAMLGYPLLKR